MFVNVVNGGNVDSFDYLLFPDQNPINQQWIYSQLNNFSNSLTDYGKQFMDSAKEVYEKINNADSIRMAKAAIRAAKGIFHPNAIIPLETIEDLRSAKPVMQRYIMAYPELRGLYHKQQCDGYSDSYVDIEPNNIGDKHYDYRRVMTGIIKDTVDKNGEYAWVATQYYDDGLFDESENQLTFIEKSDIIRTWDLISLFMMSKEDPTDVFGGKLAAI